MTACPTPERHPYPNEGQCWGLIAAVNTLGIELPYRCVAGHWHIAPAAEARAKRMAGRA